MPRNVNGYGVALNGTLYRSGLGTKKVRVNDLGTKMLALSRVRNIQRYGSNTRLGAYMPLPVINLPPFFSLYSSGGSSCRFKDAILWQPNILPGRRRALASKRVHPSHSAE